MRILQVCAVDFTAYHLLRPLMRGLRQAGWSVEFACADGRGAATLREEGFRHRPVPMSRAASPPAQLRATAVLAASLRRDRPDVIHTHTPAGGLVGRAAALLAGHHKVAHTFHGLPFGPGRLGAQELAFLVAERALARRTSLFFSQAAGDADRAIALGIAPPGKVVVIGNGVDTARFAPDPADGLRMRAELGIPGHALVVLMMSRLVRQKGVLEFADAAVLLAGEPRLHVVIVGEALPSDRDAVTAELDAHRAALILGPRWHRLGHREDVERVLRAADVFVLPSHREGLPRSVIEAMSSAVPVVVSDIPACRELVRDGVQGLFTPLGDAGALAATLGRLLFDTDGRGEMGRHGRETALARHDERAIIARQIDLLTGLVAR